MAFSTFNAKNHVNEFERIRDEWIEILVKNPNSSEAAQHILSINSKLDLIRTIGYHELYGDEDND